MDSEKIDELLSRYWNCETSLEEERQLQDFFSQDTIPVHLKETAALFNYFKQEKNKHLTDVSFDRNVIRNLQSPAKGKMTTLVHNAMRIAAGILVLIVAVWLVRLEVRKSVPQEVTDTYDDPRIAFEETKRALLMISKSFGTAEEKAKKLNLFNEAQQEIRKEGVQPEHNRQ